ncbi:hypothetical protein HYQ46_010685, partial [Verticillium longisporum]
MLALARVSTRANRRRRRAAVWTVGSSVVGVAVAVERTWRDARRVWRTRRSAGGGVDMWKRAVVRRRDTSVGDRAGWVVDHGGVEEVGVATGTQQVGYVEDVVLVCNVGHEYDLGRLVGERGLKLGGNCVVVEGVVGEDVNHRQAGSRGETRAAVVHNDLGVGVFGSNLVDAAGAIGG